MVPISKADEYLILPAFDKEHRFGVVSLWCGSLCRNGSTVVFEKVNGE
jgi:hypothetical protein